MLLCITMLSCFSLSVSAAPSDISSEDRALIEKYSPAFGEPFPNPALLKEYQENDAPYIIFVNEIENSAPPNWRMIQMLYHDPVLDEFLLSIDHTGISRDSVRPKNQERESISHVGRDASGFENLSDAVRDYMLTDFLFCYPNETEIVTNITAGELFETMETTFRCVGLSGSGNLDVFVRHAAIDDTGNFYRTCDLINMKRYLQKIASQNGYDEFGVLPVQFMDIDDAFSTIRAESEIVTFPKNPADRVNADTLEMAQQIPSRSSIDLANANNDRIKIDAGPEVPQLSPDWTTVTMFYFDPAVSFLKDGLYANVDSELPKESREFVLSDFPHYDRCGTFVISDVTLGELLNDTDLQYRGYRISNSGYLEVLIASSSNYSEKDLLNIYNVIQKVAFLNGYDTAIPIIFLEAPEYDIWIVPVESSDMAHVEKSIWERILEWLGEWW
ncbi:hypothetical protein McpAg1_02880 [Methanocorpusculaceae archaeon Ag1]|uniref:Uncharacterized protein n=2 Tax=Methanorbis furvi TaxID=3028299 RepID=A0AAE4S9N1_9EURY|nr:hypothetical protein [Methanocorpusculaceae archaeon Ag1]